MFIISLLKASSKLFNDQQICSPHSAILHFYIVLSSTNLPIKFVGSGDKIVLGTHSFLRLKYQFWKMVFITLSKDIISKCVNIDSL